MKRNTESDMDIINKCCLAAVTEIGKRFVEITTFESGSQGTVVLVSQDEHMIYELTGGMSKFLGGCCGTELCRGTKYITVIDKQMFILVYNEDRSGIKFSLSLPAGHRVVSYLRDNAIGSRVLKIDGSLYSLPPRVAGEISTLLSRYGKQLSKNNISVD